MLIICNWRSCYGVFVF